MSDRIDYEALAKAYSVAAHTWNGDEGPTSVSCMRAVVAALWEQGFAVVPAGHIEECDRMRRVFEAAVVWEGTDWTDIEFDAVCNDLAAAVRAYLAADPPSHNPA